MTRAHVSLRTVLVTGAAVLLLWAASFALSYVPLGAAALPVAIAVAVVKAALVALFFMELVTARLSIKMTVLSACVLTLTLVGLMVADVVTRDKPVLAVPGARP
jgi:cytochrome c oxidase subunit 4